jgi:hypothetical protein
MCVCVPTFGPPVTLIILWNCVLTASILRIYVTWQGTNVKLLDDDIEMSKHVGVFYIRRYCCDINCAFVGCNKNNIIDC